MRPWLSIVYKCPESVCWRGCKDITGLVVLNDFIQGVTISLEFNLRDFGGFQMFSQTPKI